jgi:hypothetical protein
MAIANNYCTILIISLILRRVWDFLLGRMRFKKNTVPVLLKNWTRISRKSIWLILVVNDEKDEKRSYRIDTWTKLGWE